MGEDSPHGVDGVPCERSVPTALPGMAEPLLVVACGSIDPGSHRDDICIEALLYGAGRKEMIEQLQNGGGIAEALRAAVDSCRI